MDRFSSPERAGRLRTALAVSGIGLLLAARSAGGAPLTLERSEGLRLLAESRAALSADPALALLLGIEGALRLPGAPANDTLVDALEALRERRTIDLQEPGWGLPLLTPDGLRASRSGPGRPSCGSSRASGSPTA